MVRTRGRQRTADDDGEIPAEIYAATRELMRHKTFAEISVAQILTEAQVSRATFYAYFSSRFAVLRGLLEQAMDDIFQTVSPFLRRSAEDPPEAALERSIAEVTRTWRRHRTVLQAVNHHWPTEPSLQELWLEITGRFIEAGATEIERERETGVMVSTVPSRQLAATLFWGTERVLHIAGLGMDPDLPDEDAAVEPLVALWSGALYGHPH
ncbi:TetR/AcrR family transcriptional regulator [Gordonia sp. HS-NH1]|uniref:TetR/AcrR family transcriptional regulator n=1 Tax=Gordonia sp. HS-NH1 TaxID=1435068 RepID=UPI003FA5878E